MTWSSFPFYPLKVPVTSHCSGYRTHLLELRVCVFRILFRSLFQSSRQSTGADCVRQLHLSYFSNETERPDHTRPPGRRHLLRMTEFFPTQQRPAPWLQASRVPSSVPLPTIPVNLSLLLVDIVSSTARGIVVLRCGRGSPHPLPSDPHSPLVFVHRKCHPIFPCKSQISEIPSFRGLTFLENVLGLRTQRRPPSP